MEKVKVLVPRKDQNRYEKGLPQYLFAKNINNTGESGIIDPAGMTVICLCTEEMSKLILPRLLADEREVYLVEELPDEVYTQAFIEWRNKYYEKNIEVCPWKHKHSVTLKNYSDEHLHKTFETAMKESPFKTP